MTNNDAFIVALIEAGRIRVDAENGLVFAPKSNTPEKPVGARTKKGYLRLCVSIEGRQRHFMVHRIVWVSVHGPLPPRHEVDHKDRVKTNNRIANLESVPGRINLDRAVEAGAFKNVGRKDGIRDAKGRFGKKRAGRELDGREWNEFPAVQP